MRSIIVLFFLLAAGFLGSPNCPGQTTPYQPTWKSLDARPIPNWFANAKFGIFVHWGVYSVPAYRPIGKERYASYAEWYQAEVMHKAGPGKDFHDKTYGPNFTYRQFAPLFKAQLFEPAAWASLFKKSGARYVVLTAKHHDGFCLWPSTSPYSKNWNSVETGPKRDLVGDLTKAVRAENMKMGLYFSLLEWETPSPSRLKTPYLPEVASQQSYRIPADKYIDAHLMPQLKELVMAYQPAVIFSDGAWDETSDYWKSRDFLAWLYNNAPNRNEVVVNDRWGKDAHNAHGDYHTSEYGSEDDKVGVAHPWEENQSIGGSYGFNRAENLDDYKTSDQVVHLLIDRVSRGGNLLLNVGPAADGTIPVIMQQRLTDVGQWMAVNGEAIYDTQAWKFAPDSTERTKIGDLSFTTKGKTLYVMTKQWPGKTLSVPHLKAGKQPRVTLLGLAQPLISTYAAQKLVISMPDFTPGIANPAAYVLKIENTDW